MNKIAIIFFLILLLLFFFINSCVNETPKVITDIKAEETKEYLNHSDSAKYVGMNTCKLCHQGIYNTFIKTGMGKSFDEANHQKSSGDFSKASIYDKIADLHYKAFWKKDSLYINEFRLEKKDTIHQRLEKVDYIIGSGQHTNSHLQSVNGYLNQMPMTFYTQKKHWDLPPGFENGVNTRFTRKIGLECMSCHNGYPDFIVGSENKFTKLPNGIDCERCHGPGSIHVAQRQTGSKIDTSKYIDYSIVNPAKLSIDAQFDICQRCHLQGNAILKDKKSFYDFKPGQKLSDYISVFLPKYKNADEEFIMASHADRLKQSACFIKSIERTKSKNTLKPYKDALTCITCHNPHVSVKETNKNVFNNACNNCHNSKGISQIMCSEKTVIQKTNNLNKISNCIGCHMPVSGAIDIPHVTVHDHYIRKPISKKEKNKIKTFVGLFSVNEKNPDALTRAKAYINQYDKFEATNSYLDSAEYILKKDNNLLKNKYAFIHLYFIKQEFSKIISLVNSIGEQKCFNEIFIEQSYDNLDAWAAYRIAEANYYTNTVPTSLKWFKKAIKLAPYNLDFRNKYGNALATSNKIDEAIIQFEFIKKENPKFVSAYSNLGYLKLMQGFPKEAISFYLIGEKLDPNNEALLLNLAGYYFYFKNNKMAKNYLNRIIKINPENKKAQLALKQIAI